jgi:hypothetical protein
MQVAKQIEAVKINLRQHSQKGQQQKILKNCSDER